MTATMKVEVTRLDYDGNEAPSWCEVPYSQLPPLPEGGSNRAIFDKAILQAPNLEIKDILTDLCRYLVICNFIHLDRGGEPRASYLDKVYPYAGTIEWAKTWESGKHPSGSTNVLGAVLYLLQESDNLEKVDLVIGGVFVAMLEHEKWRVGGKPLRPTIEVK